MKTRFLETGTLNLGGIQQRTWRQNPRDGVFGKWDWLANAVLFGAANWGKPWHIPSGIVSGILYAYPSRRFRSAWFGLIVHGADGLFILFLTLGLVLGLA